MLLPLSYARNGKVGKVEVNVLLKRMRSREDMMGGDHNRVW
jgi:hypothetical protein